MLDLFADERAKSDLLTVSEVAQRLRCSLSNVYSLIRSSKLKAICTGAGGKGYRVLPSEVDRLLLHSPLPSVKVPIRGALFKTLNASKLLAAWQTQGVVVPPQDEDSALSSSS